MIRIPTNRPPTHPGVIIKEDFLVPMGVSQSELAEGIRVPYQRINEVINGKRGITPSTALRLAKFFQNSPDFWMNLQLCHDLYHAQNKERQQLEKIRPLETHNKDRETICV